jgi:LysM repeat protein
MSSVPGDVYNPVLLSQNPATNVAGNLNDFLKLVLRNKAVINSLSDEDIRFVKGFSKAISSTIYINAVREDIRSGMDWKKALFVNGAEWSAKEVVSYAGTELSFALISKPNPYIVVAGVVVFIGTQYFADEISSGSKALACKAWDLYADKIVSVVSDADSSSGGAQVKTISVFDTTVGAVGIARAQEFAQQLSPQSGVTQVKVYTLTDEGTYIVQSGDALLRIAKEFNKDVNELASSNGIEIITRPDGSTFAMLKPGQVLVVNASTSLRVVTKYEYDSIKAMYDDSSTEGFGLNIVTTAEYNDWKRDAAIASFNLFGQSAIAQLNPLSLYGEMQPVIDEMKKSMEEADHFLRPAA